MIVFYGILFMCFDICIFIKSNEQKALMSTPPPSAEQSLPETYHQEKKKTGKKKRAEPQQSTVTRLQNHHKQTLLTMYCKKQSDTSCSLKSQDFYTSLTADRIKLLEDELGRKDEIITKIKTEREKEQNKVAKLSMEYSQVVSKTKEALIEGKRKLAEVTRKERGTIDPAKGHFKDSLNTNFQQGEYLTSNREALKQSQKNLSESIKESKGNTSQEIKEIMKSKEQFFKKEVKERKQQIEIRQKQVQRYKQRLKLSYKELQCQLAKENWPLLKNRYLPLQLIGTGGFGEVYKGFDIDKLCDVAIKISLPDPRLSPSAHQNLIKHLKRQIQTHKLLQHPNIVRVIDQLQFQGRLGLVMEYCCGPELKSYIRKSGCLQQREARQIVKQLIFAVKYLHDQKMKVVHFDLKPANIIFHGGLVKIVDFGICKTIDDEETKIDLTSPGIGTYWYLPPEVFDECKPHVSQKVDIWSIGVIFFQMLYGAKPFGNGFSQAKILREGVILNANKVDFPVQNPKRYRVSNQAKQFIKSCLRYDHNQRISPLQAYQHPYITDK